MPELPEVHTTATGLDKTTKGLRIENIWCDSPKQIKNSFAFFEKEILKQKIVGARRIGKNVLIDLENKKTILIHMKMTGHLMYGKWKLDKNASKKHDKRKGKTIQKWIPENSGPLSDPYNRFIHLVFSLSNGHQLALCDSRRFAKILLFNRNEIDKVKELKNLGPDPLDKNLDYKKFKERLLKKENGKIKQVLLDQEILAGIGNIYSDEILWESSIHPEEKVKDIPEKNLKKAFVSMKTVLTKSISLGGDSASDYRNIYGEKGGFQNHHNVYRLKGQKCKKPGCSGIIQRKIVGGRSAHFCNEHQKQIN